MTNHSMKLIPVAFMKYNVPSTSDCIRGVLSGTAKVASFVVEYISTETPN